MFDLTLDPRRFGSIIRAFNFSLKENNIKKIDAIPCMRTKDQ